MGNYVLGNKIGEGTFGQVLSGTHTVTKEKVCGRWWGIHTKYDKHGAASTQSQQIDRLYRLGLDDNDPPDLSAFTDGPSPPSSTTAWAPSRMLNV